jgi:hypothetical protein
MKIKPREVLFLLGPVVVLCGIALLLPNMSSLLRFINEPFRLTVQGTQLETLTPREVSEGYDTKIAVIIGRRGRPPAWWGKQNGYSGGNGGNWQIRYFSQGKTRTVLHKNGYEVDSFGWEPAYNKEKDLYVARYLCALRDIPAGDEIRLRDRVSIQDSSTNKPLCAPVWIDAVMRNKGKTATLPRVSKDSGVRIERYELDQAPPVETQNQAPRWRARFYLRRKYPRLTNLAKENIRADIEVCDANENHVSSYGSYGQDYNEFSPGEPHQVAENRNPQVYQYSFYFEPSVPPPPGALRVQISAATGDRWPQKLRIPFRDRNGRIFFTPRPNPNFHIVSARVAAPDSDQSSGADSQVEIVVQALGNSAKPIDKWKWEASYSQHVADAKGKRYWQFPFSDGAQISSPSFSTSTSIKDKMTITYPLNLSRIPKNAGRLVFKTTLGANGSQRLPVQIVVRP